MRPPQITLFTEVGNVRCADVRSWLMRQKLDFVERQLTPAREVRHGLSGSALFSTPLLVIGDRAIYGFRLDALTAAIEEYRAQALQQTT